MFVLLLGALPRLSAASEPAKDLSASYHAFSALGIDAQGAVQSSNPVLVVVWKLPKNYSIFA